MYACVWTIYVVRSVFKHIIHSTAEQKRQTNKRTKNQIQLLSIDGSGSVTMRATGE